jgi:hypothetical protein
LQTTSAFESIAAAHRENGAAADEASRPEAIPGVYPDAVGIPAVTMVKPALRRAILMILTEEPRRWRKRELYEELEHRGWLPEGKTPDKQITNRLTEMARRGEIKRHGPGVVSAALEDLDRGTRLGDEK